jgi:hypothetical protein
MKINIYLPTLLSLVVILKEQLKIKLNLSVVFEIEEKYSNDSLKKTIRHDGWIHIA